MVLKPHIMFVKILPDVCLTLKQHGLVSVALNANKILECFHTVPGLSAVSVMCVTHGPGTYTSLHDWSSYGKQF